MCKSTVQPDNHIFLAVLQACASAGDLAAGKDVHAHILASAEKPSIYVQTCLVDMYAKCGSIDDARRVFDRLPQKNVVTYTAMIAGYAQQGMGQEALILYSRMQGGGMAAPNSVTFVCLLQACASVGEAALYEGKQLHSQIKERGLHDDVVLGGSLVSMYAKCGSIGDAHSVFERLSHKNVVTWSAMMAGYAQQGMSQEVLDLYSRMREEGITSPDSVTFVCLLQACLAVGVEEGLRQGKQLHAHIEAGGLQDHMVVGASLVNMYAKLGSIDDARRVFDRLPQKDGVTWTSMIAGYAQQGMGQEALSVYRGMQHMSRHRNPPNLSCPPSRKKTWHSCQTLSVAWPGLPSAPGDGPRHQSGGRCSGLLGALSQLPPAAAVSSGSILLEATSSALPTAADPAPPPS